MRRPGKGKAVGASKQESLCNERHRRERMSELYTKLQTMVPNLFPRATRTRIIDETINYTRSLEEAIVELEAQKMAMQQQRQEEEEAITVTVSGRTAFYGWRTASRPALMANVAMVFDRHRAEVLAATVVADGNGLSNVTVTALLSAQDEGAAEGIKADLMAI